MPNAAAAWPSAGTSHRALRCSRRGWQPQADAVARAAGVDITTSSRAGSPAYTGAGGRSRNVSPRSVPCVMWIDTSPLPASRKVST